MDLSDFPAPRPADVPEGEDFHVRIQVALPNGETATISRRTTAPEDPLMLRRLLRGAAAELDQQIAAAGPAS